MKRALLALLLILGGSASADQGLLETRLVVKMPARGSKEPPVIEATVIGAPAVPMDEFTLVDNTAGPPIVLHPSKMLGSKQGPEPIAIAIVMSGWELWIGNDKEVPAITVDDPTRHPGILLMLRAALDKVDFKNAGPMKSVGMVVTYTDKATIRVPMGPLSQLTGQKLGTQKDYFRTVGVEVVQGIKLGLAELKKRQEPRKIMIVLGDGNDTNNDAAKGELANLKKQAAQDRVQTFAIVYKANFSGEANVFPLFAPNSVQITTASQLETALRDILARIDDRKYLTFPGYDVKTRTGVPWDGKVHELVVNTPKHASSPTSLKLPLWKPAP